MTEVDVDAHGDLQIPAGRTIAIPLPSTRSLTVHTLATDLAPYVVLATQGEPIGNDASTVVDALVPEVQSGRLDLQRWDPSRPWAADKNRLSALHQECHLSERGAISIDRDESSLAIKAGSCASDRIRVDPSRVPLLLIVSGPHAALVSSSPGPWLQVVDIQWLLISTALIGVVLLGASLGFGPTLLIAALLFGAGYVSRPEAIAVWALTLPLALAAVVLRLFIRLAPQRPVAAWLAAAIVLAAQTGAIVVAVLWLDLGTFGKERVTLAGDDACALVGYSTVRGDSLREGSAGIVEQLNATCAQCRGRTARFSREAQILRWVRTVVCAPSFPAPPGGEIVFIGGGNDDLFYRSSGLVQRVGDLLTVLRANVEPVAADDLHGLFEHLGARAATTLDKQAADIAAIAACARQGGRQLRFVHDFLIWDLDVGRSEIRQQSAAARQAAVLAGGGDFIDLCRLWRSRGVAWFNDFIHPSAFAQRQIAELLCTHLSPGELRRPQPPRQSDLSGSEGVSGGGRQLAMSRLARGGARPARPRAVLELDQALLEHGLRCGRR
jgi:hypothetical protein